MARICIVGPGKKFLSGITYYTIRLANALAEKHDVSCVLIRKLVPRWLFPGKKRVGTDLSRTDFSSSVRVFDGLDWYLFPSWVRLPAFVRSNPPDVVVMQWWTIAAYHHYVLLSFVIRLMIPQAKLVLVFHEVQDPLERKFWLLRTLANGMGRALFGLFDAYVTHSSQERKLVSKTYGIPMEQIEIVSQGAYDNFASVPRDRGEQRDLWGRDDRDSFKLLFWGLIRPYKGVEYLIEAFNRLSPEEANGFRLMVAGEPWDNGKVRDAIARSPYRDRIIFVDRYLSDEEVYEAFSGADAAVFPYTRASQSAAALTATAFGLPVIVSRVGGLEETMVSYKGAIFVKPRDVDDLRGALLRVREMRGRRFENPHTWEQAARGFEKVFEKLGVI